MISAKLRTQQLRTQQEVLALRKKLEDAEKEAQKAADEVQRAQEKILMKTIKRVLSKEGAVHITNLDLWIQSNVTDSKERAVFAGE